MNCKICGTVLRKKTASFCSIACKSEHQRRQVKIKPDPTKKIRCKIDGKCFDDYLNRSGALTQYSMNVLNRPFNWEDWESFVVEMKPTWNCPHCNWKSVDVNNKSGWITTHLKNAHGITPSQHCVDFPQDFGMWKTEWSNIANENMLNESEHNRVLCLECGQYMVSVTNTHLQKHGMTVEQYRKKYPDSSLVSGEYSDRLNRQYYNNESMLKRNWRSKSEQQICDFLSGLSIDFTPNHKKFGFDIDIYIPDFKLGIEFNGLYWHSQYAGGKLQNYHLNKTLLANKNGVNLIHIFEDEWLNNKDIVEGKLKALVDKCPIKVDALKCEMCPVDAATTHNFFKSNHLNPIKPDSNSFNVSLTFDDEIVSMMSFAIDVGHNCWVLNGFCDKIGIAVSGSKLAMIGYFESAMEPAALKFIDDRRWSSFDVEFEFLNFKLTESTPPKYYYLTGTNGMNRISPDQMDFTVYEKFDANKSEWENAIELGVDRIWDCGELVYEKRYDDNFNDKFNDNSTTISHPPIIESLSVGNHTTKRRTRTRREGSRKSIDVTCDICKNVQSIMGMASHLKLQHNLTVSEYVKSNSEYRPDKIWLNDVLKSVGDKFKCKICEMCCTNDAHLTSHLKNIHDVDKIDYVNEYILGGQPLYCKCGCGNIVSVMTYFPYTRDYISGHNENPMTGKQHNESTREKMKERAVGRFDLEWYIARYGAETGNHKYNERISKLSKSRAGSGNSQFIHISETDLTLYIKANPECKLRDICEYFNVGSTCIYGKFALFFGCKNLMEVNDKLNGK